MNVGKGARSKAQASLARSFRVSTSMNVAGLRSFWSDSVLEEDLGNQENAGLD